MPFCPEDTLEDKNRQEDGEDAAWTGCADEIYGVSDCPKFLIVDAKDDAWNEKERVIRDLSRQVGTLT